MREDEVANETAARRTDLPEATSEGGLELRSVTARHVGPVSLFIGRGRCMGISGPSGAGKSLLLRAMADLDPHGGDILLDGVPQSAVSGPSWRRRVGLLAAESAWWHVRVGPHFPPAGIPEEDLGRLGFSPEVMDWPVSRLSSGERQRLALLRLLAGGPDVLLLDEPTANLDAAGAQRVEAMVMDYKAARRAVIAWVGHDPSQLDRVADERFVVSRSDGAIAGEAGQTVSGISPAGRT